MAGREKAGNTETIPAAAEKQRNGKERKEPVYLQSVAQTPAPVTVLHSFPSFALPTLTPLFIVFLAVYVLPVAASYLD